MMSLQSTNTNTLLPMSMLVLTLDKTKDGMDTPPMANTELFFQIVELKL